MTLGEMKKTEAKQTNQNYKPSGTFERTRQSRPEGSAISSMSTGSCHGEDQLHESCVCWRRFEKYWLNDDKQLGLNKGHSGLFPWSIKCCCTSGTLVRPEAGAASSEP